MCVESSLQPDPWHAELSRSALISVAMSEQHIPTPTALPTLCLILTIPLTQLALRRRGKKYPGLLISLIALSTAFMLDVVCCTWCCASASADTRWPTYCNIGSSLMSHAAVLGLHTPLWVPPEQTVAIVLQNPSTEINILFSCLLQLSFHVPVYM